MEQTADLAGDGLALRPSAHSASLVDAPSSARANWQGVDYSDHIFQRAALPPQDYVVFTYDDWQVGQTSGLYVSQWEMYDLKHDSLERENLAHGDYKRTPAQEKQYRRLRRKLARVKATRLQPLHHTREPTVKGSPTKPAPLSAMD